MGKKNFVIIALLSLVSPPLQIMTRPLDDESHCPRKAWLGDWKEITIARDSIAATTRQAREKKVLLTMIVLSTSHFWQ